MKILVLSPFYGPMKNGLSDYSNKFVSSLKERGHDVEVICNSGLLSAGESYFEASSWNMITFFRLFLRLLKADYDVFLIEFVPHMYLPRGGLVPSLGLFCIFLRLFGKGQIHTMFHELHSPFSFYWKDILMWSCHHFMFLSCLWSGHKNFFSTNAFLRKGQLYSLRDNCYWLPVGSNIERYRYLSLYKDEKDSLHSNTSKIKSFCLFGGLHPSRRLDLIFNGLKFADEIHYIGLTREELPIDLRAHPICEKITFHGKLSNEEVARVMASCDCLVAYFVDGMSSRRGSVLAAINQGLSVISTYDWGTDAFLKSWPGLTLVPTNEKEFSRLLSSFVTNFSSCSERRKIIQNEFDQVFSWDSIMRSYHDRASLK